MTRGKGNSRNRQGDWQAKAAQWMQGRYGIDELTQALMIFGCVLVVVNFFVQIRLFSFLSLVVFVLGILRCYSRNFSARNAELETYRRVSEKPKAFFRLNKRRFENRKTTLYFRCRGCGTVLNVPKGKGKLLVTCPKCGTKVEKHS